MIDRRQMLQRMASAAAAGALAGAGALTLPRAARAEAPADDPHFVIVLCASGGASIIDAMMAIRESESPEAATLNCFPDALVQGIDGSPFRALDQDFRDLGPIPARVSGRQSDFLRRHHRELMVATVTGTSVNHAVAQRRAVTGNEAWAGRTLQEAVALQYGRDFVLPNVVLLPGVGFSERGGDDTLPPQVYGEVVADPLLWPLSLDGARGITGAPSKSLVERARALRDGTLDPRSRFHRVFHRSPRLAHWQHLRSGPQRAVEAADLIRRLMVMHDTPDFPLAAHGLGESPEAALVRERFPDFASDPLHAQAALAFLLLKYRLSVSVTLGPFFDLVLDGDYRFDIGAVLTGGANPDLPAGALKNPPIAFDFSHQAHRAVQSMMWGRLLRVADGLIELLKSEEYADGQSLWDRTLIYVATEFGRSKRRPAGAREFGSGHDLNNGVAVISPLVNGNSLLGGVDPATGLTYGFDPQTGAPEPGRTMTERHIFSGLLHALKVDTSGAHLPDMRAMRRHA